MRNLQLINGDNNRHPSAYTGTAESVKPKKVTAISSGNEILNTATMIVDYIYETHNITMDTRCQQFLDVGKVMDFILDLYQPKAS